MEIELDMIKRIGIDCRLINMIQNTGISRYTKFMINYYGLRFGEEKILLITNDKQFTCKGFKILFTTYKPYNLRDFLRFGALIRDSGIDYLHSPFYSSFAFKPKNVVSVITVHDLMYRLVPHFFSNNAFLNFIKKKYFDLIVHKSIKNSDLIVSISETTKEDVLKAFGALSIHIPEDSEIALSNDQSIITQFNLTKQNYFFYCGNSRPHKNLDFVIKTFNKHSDLPTLVLAGKGHIDSPNVISVGMVSDEQLSSLYAGAIAFIFPSSYEGFGLPILESIRLNTPVIASRISAFLEFNSKNIHFFSLNDEDELLLQIRAAAPKTFHDDTVFLEKYNHERIYKLTDEAIKTLV